MIVVNRSNGNQSRYKCDDVLKVVTMIVCAIHESMSWT